MAARKRKGRGTAKQQGRDTHGDDGSGACSKAATNTSSAPTSTSSRIRLPMHVAAIAIPILSVLLVKGVVRNGIQGSTNSSHGDAANNEVEKTSEHTGIINRSPKEIIEDIFVGAAYTVLETFHHDPEAFTQGLTYYGGKLYEGTGLNGMSQLRELDIFSSGEVGSVLRSVKMDSKYFGEGIAHYHDANGTESIIQLTWKERTGFIYDAQTFNVLKQFSYETVTKEGWGVTYDASTQEFIVSDGSEWLFFWDRDTLKEKRRIQVTVPQLSMGTNNGEQPLMDMPVNYLNELEMVNGLVFANIWYQNVLVAINPQDGKVVRVFDFGELYKDRTPTADCFNGISVTEKMDEVFVTGKNWPHMYRIKLL